MKSIATLEAEQYLYDSLIIDKMGMCGCHEVVIGRKPLTHGREIVDFLTYDTRNIFRAYEIKVSKADLKSSAKLSFVGHYNYLVLPRNLYEEVKCTDLSSILKQENVGIVIIGEGIIRKSGRKTLTMGDNVMLMDSLNCALNRENVKIRRGKRLS
ncbi:hypothetical protein [Staphylococcus schweitzeri]|uniref:Uncharacterized protein n=1 Tax=Staphylococcus schweitzeri TaxID=1654388 RepID=A0A077UDH0_9STAP|nr:hypothetical protein [Staphylococcus schweitzeri]CDR26544.1 hypothetical protein ERS140147_00058 [Staphylococcus schweitzeri]